MDFVLKAGVGSFVAIAALAAGCDSDPLNREAARGNPLGPAGEGRGVRVFSGFAATLEPEEACTAEEGSEHQRWCGFVALSSQGERNLYVVNVSQ